MDKYKVRLNQQAFREINDIFAYIALEKLSPENAKGQTDRIWEALKKLEIFPQSHQERTEGKYAGKGYRQLLIDNYIAIFRIDESNKTVYVVTVLLTTIHFGQEQLCIMTCKIFRIYCKSILFCSCRIYLFP